MEGKEGEREGKGKEGAGKDDFELSSVSCSETIYSHLFLVRLSGSRTLFVFLT